MRFLFKRDCGDHVPFCFITAWTVCSSGTFFFRGLSPLHNRTGILRGGKKVTIKKTQGRKIELVSQIQQEEQVSSFSQIKRICRIKILRTMVQFNIGNLDLRLRLGKAVLLNNFNMVLKDPSLSCRFYQHNKLYFNVKMKSFFFRSHPFNTA